MLRIRVSETERRALERRARAEGLPVTTWIRTFVLKDAGEAEELERRKKTALAAIGSLRGAAGEELAEHVRKVRAKPWRRPASR